MAPHLIAMQSMVHIFEYRRPDVWLRSNTEFVLLARSQEMPHLVIGVGPKSRGDEIAAPDDLAALHVIVGTRIGKETDGEPSLYLLNRHLPDGLALPERLRAGQFFPADGVAELAVSEGLPRLSAVGRHAHLRDGNGQIMEVTKHRMRARVHVDGRVGDTAAALAWRFTAQPLPWTIEK